MSILYKNLDKTKSFEKLRQAEMISLKENLNPERIQNYNIKNGGGLKFNYAAKKVDENILSIFQELADEQQVIDKYSSLLRGDKINTGEDRMVLHHHTRGTVLNDLNEEGKKIEEFYKRQTEEVYEFARKIHTGRITGSTGKRFNTVIQIGIGGSDLGPRAIHIALRNYAPEKMKAYFISNIDPDDAEGILSRINYETTLFITVSKSGTTQETLTNESFIIGKMLKSEIEGLDPSKHFIAVTSETSPMATSNKYLRTFFIDDYIGGRYSSTSVVGGTVLTLALGDDIFKRFLRGANESDRNALEPDIRNNAALLDALIGIYERNILNAQQTTVIPYSQALARFPAHLQQLDMESNGKSVNRASEPVDYQTGPVILGEPGTNAQHSFFQLLHQGTTVSPIQFIGFKEPQINADLEFQGTTSEQKLNANLAAQITALAMGQNDNDLNKNFDGERPTSLIYGRKLTPEAMGALLAHFENKVMFQGFLWNINSFDQEGVQLGKKLAKNVLSGTMSPVLKAFSDLLS